MRTRTRNLFVALYIGLFAIIGFTAGGLFSSCALKTSITSQPTTQAQALTILSDAQWGVSFAHDQLWLSDSEYTIITQSDQAAADAVRVATSGFGAVAKSILTDLSSALSPTSRLQPYIAAALLLLH